MAELTLKAIENLLDAKFKEELTPIKTAMAKLATSEELRTTERSLIKHAEDLQADLARVIATTVANPFTKRFDELEKRLDVRDRLERDEKVIKQLAVKVGMALDW